MLMPSLRLFSFAFLLLVVTGLHAKKAEVEKTKSVNENYTVNTQQIIQLSNKFGEMNITSWDKNEVSVSILIKVKGPNEKKTQEMLDNITIDILQNDEKLSITTNLKNNKDQIKQKVNESSHLSIDYNIKVPSANRLEVKNAFGPLSIDKMKSTIKVDQSFGSASIGELEGMKNELTFKFSDPIIINSIKEGKLTLKYSKLELRLAEKLQLDSEMSSTDVEKVDQAVLSAKYGSLDIANANDLKVKSQMSSVKIVKVNSTASFDTQYGTLNVDELAKELSSLTIKAQFSPVKITLNNQASYAADLKTNMSKLKLPKGSEKEESDNNLGSAYTGTLGNSGTAACTLKVRSSFGNVNINFP